MLCTFWHTVTLSAQYILVHSTHIYLPMKMEQTECSETSAYKIQTPGNYPKERQHSVTTFEITSKSATKNTN